CFLDGCCFGIPCALPWCVTFPADSYVYQLHASLGLLPPGAPRSAPVHPLQLYFAGAGLLVTATALAVRRRRRFDGEPTLVALLVYSVSAAALGFLRGERAARGFWGPLPQLEWGALALTGATGGALVLPPRRTTVPRRRRGSCWRRGAPASPGGGVTAHPAQRLFAEAFQGDPHLGAQRPDPLCPVKRLGKDGHASGPGSPRYGAYTGVLPTRDPEEHFL